MKVLKTILLILVFVVGVWGQVGAKTSYGILIDNTGSMRTQLAAEREFAKAILSEVGTYPVTIFKFDTAGHVARLAFGTECSDDRTRLTREVDEIFTIPGQTTLRDAINGAVVRLRDSGIPPCRQAGEKILVLLSDGDDRTSSIESAELMKNLKASSVRIYVIGLIEELKPKEAYIFKSPLSKSKGFLKRLATESNGRIVFPENKETAQEVVARLFSANYKAEK